MRLTSNAARFYGRFRWEKIRAFETHSGRELWGYQLPAGGYATPSVYVINGKRSIVIAGVTHPEWSRMALMVAR
jgi:quinoprotein glucose dehydrogenase